ncbi:MAG: aspartate aminotransferase family protein [candidate division KSB1 bacterium]|nr:aspartate aminotransferase family protein [candidate division KSB1 bacterium]MDZ7346127.1 aspartate aminotransferase family protein [candidate division KSB1 bacterium]
MTTNEWIELERRVLLNTYARPDFVIDYGRGSRLYDLDGKEYLDFVAGIAVCAFGHADERSQQVLAEQAARLWHCSNLYHFMPQIKLAEFLIEHTFADKAFFCNSGTEAVEAAIKFSRKWAKEHKGAECYEIIAMKKSFHGRTYGALSATGQMHLHAGFEPMLSGFRFAEFNDAQSAAELITDKTCAVIVEPVQGEGGIYPASVEFLRELRRLCDVHNLLLIFDEIQCGFGRTGWFCAHEAYGVQPDIMVAAKPIAGGLPLGAVLVTDRVAACIKPGDHGTTFGGGPLASAVALDILQRIAEPSFLESVRQKGEHLGRRLEEARQEFPIVTETRGAGLMRALEVSIDPKILIRACEQEGLLICKTGGQAVRFLPPLNVTHEEIDEAAAKLHRALVGIGVVQ